MEQKIRLDNVTDRQGECDLGSGRRGAEAQIQEGAIAGDKPSIGQLGEAGRSNNGP